VNCLLFKNPTRNLAPIENKLPRPSGSEEWEAAPEMAVPDGPGGTPEKLTRLADRERLAQRIVGGSMARGFSCGQLCPRRIVHNPFFLLRFFVFVKLDLCKIAQPLCFRRTCLRSLRNEFSFNVHRGLPSSSFVPSTPIE
jgi:hypothetical protein